MRIVLKKGKQKELILIAKKDLTWKKFSKILNVCEGYLAGELKYEKRLLSEKLYLKLCKLSKINFNKYIQEKLEDNWGRSKGGLNSSNNIKQFYTPKKSKKLAEIFGIILGDGHVSEFKKGKKIRVYCARIAGNSKTDRDYIFNYVPKLFENVFKEKGGITNSKTKDCGYFTLYGKKFIEFLKSKGLKSGNKLKNNQGIPNWIKKDEKLLGGCIKGLIDTDGSVQHISKNNKRLRIDFTSHIPKLLVDVREGFIKLGFNPCKIINNRHFFLSKQEEILRYVKEIGFSNSKNLNRYNLLKNC